MAAVGARTRARSLQLALLLFVALAGVITGPVSAAAAGAAAGTTTTLGGGDHNNAAAALLVASSSSSSLAAAPTDLNGMMQCMMGCFTQVFGCALGCMGKGPDLPLCIISCNQKSIVCMVRCGLSPSPPKPTPPGPKPPSPKPPAPKPPAPAPPTPSPPDAVAGRRGAGAAA